MVSLFGKAGKGGREGEKAVCSEGQHSGPGLVLNRLCRVRPGPRWDSLSPPQTLSDSIQGLHCPRFCSGAGQKPELPGWEVSRGLQPPPTPQPQIPLCPCSHPAPARDREVPSLSHTQPQIPLCPCSHPCPSERPGGAQPVIHTTADPSVSPAVAHAPPRDRSVPSLSHTPCVHCHCSLEHVRGHRAPECSLLEKSVFIPVRSSERLFLRA